MTDSRNLPLFKSDNMPSPPRRRKRPRIPDPPESLIKLIQNDTKVLAYMKSLQANLDEDVRIWKERARNYQKRLEKYDKQQPQKHETTKRVKQKETPLQLNEVERTGDEVAVDESMFDLLSSSDSDEDMETQTQQLSHETLEPKFESDILPHIDQALWALERIGVPLASKEKMPASKPDDSIADGETDDTFIAPFTTNIYTRRTDAQVISDILLQVNAWTRVERAFDAQTLSPTLVVQQGLQLLFRALVILDTFYECNHDTLLANPANYAGIVGGRKEMVQTLLRTLSAEISETWACQNRSNRHATPSLQYSQDENAGLSLADTDAADESMENCSDNNYKNRSRRLAPLVKSRLLAELTIGMYLSRNDYDTASQVAFNYIASSVPTLVEDYPSLPPVLSLVVLEGILRPSTLCRSIESSGAKETDHCSNWFINSICEVDKNVVASKNVLCQVLSRCIHRTARIWKWRMNSPDARIHEVAQVECASYRRMLASDSSWLVNDGELPAVALPVPMYDHSHGCGQQTYFNKTQLLSYLLTKNFYGIQESFREALVSKNHAGLVPLAEAGRQLILRQLDLYQEYSNKTANSATLFALTGLLDQALRSLESNSAGFLHAFLCFVMCCGILADGKVCVQLLETLVQMPLATLKNDTVHMLNMYRAIDNVSDQPCVHIINLKRRADRRSAFMAQAMREKLLVAPAIVPFDPPLGQIGNIDALNGYAFDSMGRAVEGRAYSWRGSGAARTVIKALVNCKWRPTDLQLFDRNAPDNDALVEMSDSEVACALSHVASWQGAKKVLNVTISVFDDEDRPMNSLFEYPLHMLRRCKIAGFARGQALLSINADIAPAPVVVILEDDAVLVDRFRERLEELLEQLPRDFHFCSIGYGRPKTAPIVPFNSQCGVPTHLFYLTGYILSPSGAEHLLASLPVAGPVDCFIGLKMTSNWDNVFGEAVGLGVQGKPLSGVVAKEELASLLKFRAFCALQPICSQRIGRTTLTGRAWRQRDTDIQYSGDRRKRNF